MPLGETITLLVIVKMTTVIQRKQHRKGKYVQLPLKTIWYYLEKLQIHISQENYQVHLLGKLLRYTYQKFWGKLKKKILSGQR